MVLDLESRRPGADALASLYRSVGWTDYASDPDALARAVTNTTWVRSVWKDDQLVGLCRAMSDGYSICYLQDVLVHPEVQGQGLGKRLVTACLSEHANVRQFVLMTDDRPEQLRLYEGVGLARLGAIERFKLNVFLRIRGVDLIGG